MDKKDPDNGGQIDFKSFGFESNGEPSKARDENLFQSLRHFCCPYLSILQFIVLISFVEIFIFIISLVVYGVSNEDFLAPDYYGLR